MRKPTSSDLTRAENVDQLMERGKGGVGENSVNESQRLGGGGGIGENIVKSRFGGGGRSIGENTVKVKIGGRGGGAGSLKTSFVDQRWEEWGTGGGQEGALIWARREGDVPRFHERDERVLACPALKRASARVVAEKVNYLALFLCVPGCAAPTNSRQAFNGAVNVNKRHPS